jgi:hypothetical protein
MNRPLILIAVFVLAACKKNGADDPVVPDNTPVVKSTLSPKPEKGCGGGFYSVHYGDAMKTLHQAEEFKPQSRDSYVSVLSDRRNEYLLAGISPSFRARWFESHGIAEKDQHCMLPVFNELAVTAKRTLPNYRPHGYTHHDSSEETLIKDAVKAELADAEFLGVGVSSPTWNIEKHRNGIPSSRYKYGMAWVKSASLDDGYCRIAYVNIVQDYSGEGTYGESVGNSIRMEPAGCK